MDSSVPLSAGETRLPERVSIVRCLSQPTVHSPVSGSGRATRARGLGVAAGLAVGGEAVHRHQEVPDVVTQQADTAPALVAAPPCGLLRHELLGVEHRLGAPGLQLLVAFAGAPLRCDFAVHSLRGDLHDQTPGEPTAAMGGAALERRLHAADQIVLAPVKVRQAPTRLVVPFELRVHCNQLLLLFSRHRVLHVTSSLEETNRQRRPLRQ